MKAAGVAAFMAATLSVVGGCATEGYSVAGKDKNILSFDQSETALTTAFAGDKHIVVVACNDATDTAGTIVYTPTTRKTLTGASLMGWFYSLDQGRNWTHGGKLTPPKGWAALWGDPGITTSQASYQYVFMSNLAIPSDKMPAGGIDGPVNNYLGGACIARSTDGGISFSVYQMLTNAGHFYDGGSMAAAKAGDIYAGFVDVDTNRIDVWRSPSAGGQFAMLPNPFPEMSMYSHPRLRVNPPDGALYVAAQASDYTVFMARWNGSSWSKALRVSNPAELYPEVHFASGRKVRTGPQFSFDVGAASEGGSDAIRLLYTQRDAKTGRLYVTGSYASLDLSSAHPAPEWGTTPGNLNTPGDQFNPNVSAWAGFPWLGLAPVWKGAYVDRKPDGGDTVDLHQGNLAYFPDGTRIYLPFPAIKKIPICADLRGYWGDYDDMVVGGFPEDGSTTPEFIRTISDSSLGCVNEWQYTSHHLHIRAAVFK